MARRPPRADAPPYRPSTAARWNQLCAFSVRNARSLPASCNQCAELRAWLPLTPEEAVKLEWALQRELRLPPFLTVFAVVRSDESPYAPLIPLLLLHGVCGANEPRCEVDALVRPMIQAQPELRVRPAPLPALPLALLMDPATRAAAGLELLTRLRRFSVARLRATADLAACLDCCLAELPAFFRQPRPTKARLHCDLRPDEANDRGYAGMGQDAGREWLQVRRRQPPPRLDTDATCDCLPEGTPPALAAAFVGLRHASAACLGALAEGFGVAPECWLNLTDLCDPPMPPPPPVDGGTVRLGGPSVWRCFSYLPEGRGTGCHAHADLGLLTLDPAPTHPGLLVYDCESLEWAEAEGGMAPDEITIFAGEQLAYLTGGVLPAPLHRVPAPAAVAGVEGSPRISMPFFVRAHPDATLRPAGHAEAATPARAGEAVDGGASRAPARRLAPVRTEEFVLEHLFRKRPWRPNPSDAHPQTPDY